MQVSSSDDCAPGGVVQVCLPASAKAHARAADEFFILRDPRIASLPALLSEFEDFGALAVNWQVRQGAACESVCACSLPFRPLPLPMQICQGPCRD